jgi:hypothetical protein
LEGVLFILKKDIATWNFDSGGVWWKFLPIDRICKSLNSKT